ncbi:MAG TPA: 4Fe-4S binding protein, partial [Dehalococcoidales bacterium]|nr:4Fe-4S binding protein [Dehalococcoidales bacterium]
SPLIRRERLTPQREAEMLLKHVAAGAGYINLPGSRHVSREVYNDLIKTAKHFHFTDAKRGFRFIKNQTPGMANEGLYLLGSLVAQPDNRIRQFEDYTSKVIEILKREKPKDIPLVANINGFGAFPETWVSGAKVHEQAGVDMIEINVSCAHGGSMEGAVEDYFEQRFPMCNPGLLVGDQVNLVAAITEKVVGAVSLPVGVKLSPETGFPRIVEMAKRIKEAGAKFINCSNNAVVIAPPDIYRGGKSKWPFTDENPFVAGSGSWMRMITYKQIAVIAKFVPGIDLIATGGLTVPEHTVEAMMLGARATETATAVMYSGRGFLKRQIRFLHRYMETQGYHSVEDFIGLGLKYITPAEKVDFKIGKIYAEVDSLKCTGCGICADQMCLAMEMEDKIAKVNIDDCLGCGMCVALCPKGAVSVKLK